MKQVDPIKDNGDQLPEQLDLPENHQDFPPESFCLSKDAEFDWFDRNAVLERKESTKGKSNCTTTILNPNSNCTSQRIINANLKSKTSIFGLPRAQKTCFTENQLRRNTKLAANIQLFTKRSQSVNKSKVPSEPLSPKVSCMGRVRSRGDRRRRLTYPQQSPVPTTTVKVNPKHEQPHRKAGLMSSLRSLFRISNRDISPVEIIIKEPPTAKARVDIVEPPMSSVTAKTNDASSAEPVADAPGLGVMNRFASGRRSEIVDTEVVVVVVNTHKS